MHLSICTYTPTCTDVHPCTHTSICIHTSIFKILTLDIFAQIHLVHDWSYTHTCTHKTTSTHTPTTTHTLSCTYIAPHTCSLTNMRILVYINTQCADMIAHRSMNIRYIHLYIYTQLHNIHTYTHGHLRNHIHTLPHTPTHGQYIPCLHTHANIHTSMRAHYRAVSLYAFCGSVYAFVSAFALCLCCGKKTIQYWSS